MKKIVLFGAFDRYNYGDNLMPILFNKFIEKYRPEILLSYEVQYAAISSSKLSHYECEPSKKMNELLNALDEGSAVIVIGGEVLCAKNSVMYLHMQNSLLHNKILGYIKKLTKKYFSLYSDLIYSTKWEYPFIVDPANFNSSVKVIYNTVGGSISELNSKDKRIIINRLNKASYISIRDTRTKEELEQIDNTVLSPDSAFLMSDLIDNSTFYSLISDEIKLDCDSDYIVFQAAPKKVGSSMSYIVDNLNKLSEKHGKKIILLPIGYASGHDDYQYLSKLSRELNCDHKLLYNLNIWEIMFVIKESSLFIGTSLHGVITAMAFARPHIGLNPKIRKLDSFIKDWSIKPFNKCQDISSADNILRNVDKSTFTLLEENRNRINKMILENNNKIIDVIVCK
ncbi:polysaccharide pyruvyl transferase family protein [Pseudoalteromonas sp. SR43-5]|jgi:hypothetical protein|uniref:polysaccharide pyruvyl transferase family protein n=1 Tax=Pseudoalteromonas sp. SR43-5 TaxID=2760941 RepID=UPI0015FCC3C2|nr:polysaccharide pyruvyl transferase family protein [Pseudoalteromonas sp. SR43-5]MBB1304775.1 polysaccharide pyruvyl transferase family protein [Pseudoalteromonas sp. SR43-5]